MRDTERGPGLLPEGRRNFLFLKKTKTPSSATDINKPADFGPCSTAAEADGGRRVSAGRMHWSFGHF